MPPNASFYKVNKLDEMVSSWRTPLFRYINRGVRLTTLNHAPTNYARVIVYPICKKYKSGNPTYMQVSCRWALIYFKNQSGKHVHVSGNYLRGNTMFVRCIQYSFICDGDAGIYSTSPLTEYGGLPSCPLDCYGTDVFGLLCA